MSKPTTYTECRGCARYPGMEYRPPKPEPSPFAAWMPGATTYKVDGRTVLVSDDHGHNWKQVRRFWTKNGAERFALRCRRLHAQQAASLGGLLHG